MRIPVLCCAGQLRAVHAGGRGGGGVLPPAGFNFCGFAGRLGLARLGQARRASGGHPFPAGWWWLSGAQPARAAGRGLRSCPVRPSAQDPDGLTSPVSAAGGILGTFIWARRAHPRWAAPSAGGLRGRPGEIKVPETPQRPRPTVGRPLKRSENYLPRKSIRGADAHAPLVYLDSPQVNQVIHLR